MEKHTLLVRQIDRFIYDFIESGQKKIETRAASPRYENIKDSDIIVFKCGKDSFERIVKNVRKFKSIDQMLEVYNFKDINPLVKTVEELKMMYNSFPGYAEKIEKYGVIAFELVK